MTTYETLSIEADQGVVTLTLNRPAVKNALNRQMGDELEACLHAIARDPAQRVLVITGADGNFCAGGDIGGMSAGGTRSAAQARQDFQRYRRITQTLHEMDKPVIAAVDGVAYGAGMSLALLADMVLVSDRVRLSMAFARVGLIPDLGAMYTLPRAVGTQRAKELVFSGRVLEAAEAQALGIAMEVVPAADLPSRAAAIAHSLLGASPTAVALAKRVLGQSFECDLPAVLELESSGQAIALSSDYMDEARRRFLAKQPPQFQWPTREPAKR
jgi:2-(1,2-epoxy-1,2-dihydrophenyl)acetyl-CoA isomerase